jgi:hypothetical protein
MHWKKYRVGIIASSIVLVFGFLINDQLNPYKKRLDWLKNEVPKYHLVASKDSISGSIASVFSTRGFAYISFCGIFKG